MKLVVANLLVMGVMVVTAMPQEPETQFQFSLPTGTDFERLDQIRKDMDSMMISSKLCMMKRIMTRCECSTIEGGGCPVLTTMMQCHKEDMKSWFMVQLVGEDKFLDNPFPMSQQLLNQITDEDCMKVLPPPKHVLMMMMKDETCSKNMVICMTTNGQFDNFKKCIVEELKTFLPLKPGA